MVILHSDKARTSLQRGKDTGKITCILQTTQGIVATVTNAQPARRVRCFLLPLRSNDRAEDLLRRAVLSINKCVLVMMTIDEALINPMKCRQAHTTVRICEWDGLIQSAFSRAQEGRERTEPIYQRVSRSEEKRISRPRTTQTDTSKHVCTP